MSWMTDLRVARILFQGLVQNDVFSDGYDIIPGVAHRWDVERVQTDRGIKEVYTFHLRSDARWSNGELVTAHDFVYSWRRAILPDSVADYSGLFFLIDGAEDFFLWRTEALAEFGPPDRAKAEALWAESERRFNETVGVRAIDDWTLEVRLTKPTPYFLDLAAFATFYPVYPPLVSQYETLQDDGRIKIEAGWTKPPHIISNGAFVLTSWRFKRGMRLERNEHFWDAESINVDSIAIPTIDGPNGAILAFDTGAIDWLSDVGPAYKADMLADKREFYEENRAEYERLLAEGWDQFEIDRRLPDDPRKNIHAVPAFATYWYNFNCRERLPDGRENPFFDPRVRRAFAMMVDKRSIVEDVRRLGEPVARTVIPPRSIGGYDGPVGLPCISDARDDVERQAMIDEAKALLAEAGYPDPGEFPDRRAAVQQGRRARPDRAGDRQELVDVSRRADEPGPEGAEGLSRGSEERQLHDQPRRLVWRLWRSDDVPGSQPHRRRQQRPQVLQPRVRRPAGSRRARAGPRSAHAAAGGG